MTQTDRLAALLDLFAGPLEGVKFPDVDAGVLASQAALVESSAAAVESARVVLDEARRAQDDAERSLEARLDRALAYLRVYADGNDALLVELERVSTPVTPAPAPRRRVRQPKAEDLFNLAPPSGT